MLTAIMFMSLQMMRKLDRSLAKALIIDEAWQMLKPGNLHLDCWAEIHHADGYDVTLRPEPFGGDEKHYYINLGGYDRAQFTE